VILGSEDANQNQPGTGQEGWPQMREKNQHIPFAVIREVVEGRIRLLPDQLRHFHDCDLCSQTWWELKREAKRQKENDAKKKSA